MFAVRSAVGMFRIGKKGEFLEFKPFSSEDDAVEELLKGKEEEHIPNRGYEVFWERQKEFIETAGLSYSEYLKSRHRVAVKVAEEMLLRSVKEESAIIHSIETLEDVQKALNILTSRLIATCSAYGLKLEINEEEADYRKVLESGRGASTPAVEQLSAQIEDLVDYKDSIEGEIEGLMTSIAPNLAGLLGPLLGAKLISLAKGLERLARMPGSRIQVFGAGKAMFRHLREKGKPPKHGIIFQHPTISKSPWWQRGKIARSLAAKIAIAARLDAYSDVDCSRELKGDFMKRYEAVKKAYGKEPKRMRIIRAPKPKRKRRRR